MRLQAGRRRCRKARIQGRGCAPGNLAEQAWLQRLHRQKVVAPVFGRSEDHIDVGIQLLRDLFENPGIKVDAIGPDNAQRNAGIFLEKCSGGSFEPPSQIAIHLRNPKHVSPESSEIGSQPRTDFGFLCGRIEGDREHLAAAVSALLEDPRHHLAVGDQCLFVSESGCEPCFDPTGFRKLEENDNGSFHDEETP